MREAANCVNSETSQSISKGIKVLGTQIMLNTNELALDGPVEPFCYTQTNIIRRLHEVYAARLKIPRSSGEIKGLPLNPAGTRADDPHKHPGHHHPQRRGCDQPDRLTCTQQESGKTAASGAA